MMRIRDAMMMTRRKLYVTLNFAACAVMALCGVMIAGCDDQLLPPEQPAQVDFQGKIFYSAPMPSGPDSILSVSATEGVPRAIAMGLLTSAPQKGNIAYYRADGASGIGEVYINDTAGTNEQFIYSGTVDPASITLAPDGVTVGFLGYYDPTTYELYIATAAGLKYMVPLYNMEIVTFSDQQSVWLTSGGDTAYIASISLGKGQLGYIIYTIDLVNGAMITSEYYGMSFMTGLALSADFQPALTVTGDGTGGSGLITLSTVNNYQRENLLLEGNDYYHSPAWSPDGENIAFTVNSAISAVQSMDLYTISTRAYIGNADDESPLRRITYTPSTIEAYTDWSPDGGRILFSELPTYVINPDTWQTGRLVIVDPQSKQTRVVAENAYRGFWSRG